MSSSEDSDAGPQHKRKRKSRPLKDSPSSTSSGSPIICASNSRRRTFRTVPIADSDDSGSPILNRPRKKIVKVPSDSESDSSDYAIVRRTGGPRRLESDSDDDLEVSDRGFEGSSSSQWESDFSDTEPDASAKPEASNPKPINDNNVDSDFSDGQSEKCPICLVSFKTQEIGSPESCDHTFCLECIQEWSKNMNTCPIDRQEYNLILVRQTLDGKVTKQIPISAPTPQNEVDIIEDPTYCEICGSCDNEDRMLLCDGCDLGFHLYCLTPPLDEVPIGAWHCNDCSPDDVYNSDIELYEVHLLLDDAESMERPEGPRRRNLSARLIPRTRQSERVRRRIQNIRQQNSHNNAQEYHSPSTIRNTEISVTVTSSTSTRRSTKKRKSTKRRKTTKKTEYRIVYEIDEVTGETVAVKRSKKKSTKSRRGRSRRSRSNRPTIKPKTVKKRLAQQLGICTPRSVPQNLPDVKLPNTPNNIRGMRQQAGIPTLHLFGQSNDLDYFSGDDEDYSPGPQICMRRAPNLSDISLLRRARQKNMITLPDTVSSSTDLLGSILSSQEQFHSKNASFSVDSSGTFKIEKKSESSKNYIDVTKEQATTRETPYYNNNRNYNNSNNRYYQNNRYQNNRYNRQSNNYYPNNQNYYNSEPSSSMGFSDRHGRGEDNNSPQDYTQRTLCASTEPENQESEEKEENAAAGSSKPNSESELDIYSDIETVSTSKPEENYMRPPSPPIISNNSNTPNTCTDEDNNDSEPDMVIDDEKVQEQENVEDKRGETVVTSTVDYSNDVEPPCGFYESDNYSKEIQSGAVQSSNLDYLKNYGYEDEDSTDGCPNTNIYSKEAIKSSNNMVEDADSDDGCPNFSIYSKESKSVALHTDISMPIDSIAPITQDYQVGEISSSPNIDSLAQGNHGNQQESTAHEPECTYDPEQTYDPEKIYEQDESIEGDNNQSQQESYDPSETYDPAKCFEEESCDTDKNINSDKNYDPEQAYDPEKIYDEDISNSEIIRQENSNPEKMYDPESCYDPERELSDGNSQGANTEINDSGDRYDPLIPFDGEINDEHTNSEHIAENSADEYQEAVNAFNREFRKSDETSEMDNERNESSEEGELEKSENKDDDILQSNVVAKPKIKGGITGGLYSDSEDESIVRKDGSNFGLSDINHMTEDISEEERSYTPCLDEKSHKQGLEGLDTEMISDEDRNDFDESHELKTVSDGDALEINAKESELDFTRPEDYEEGEIVDRNKDKTIQEEEPEVEPEVETEPPKKKEEVKEVKKNKKKEKEKQKSSDDIEKDKEKGGNKENEGINKEQTFKKLSKNNKERNYRKDDKDRDREKRHSSPRRSRDREQNKKEKKREKRKEIERYNVRALIAEKPRPLIAKDQFGRDIRETPPRSRSRSYTPPIQRSMSRERSKSRSLSRRRKSISKEREKSRKRRPRSRNQRHASKSRSRSPIKKRSGSKNKKRKRSSSQYRKRKQPERSRTKKRAARSRSRHRSRTPSAIRRQRDWERLDWTPMSQGMEQPRNMSPSWTPPRISDNSQVLRNEHLTVTLNNTGKKKKDKKRKGDKRNKDTLESRQKKRRHERERTPPPSKEVFASGDNILVSVSFNNENETRDITTRDKRRSDENSKKRKEKKKKNRKDLSGVKPVAIIDLERSPFKEITPSPKHVIVLSDSENEENETRNVQESICDSSQQVASPERTMNYTTGPKTPPEPQIKFTLSTKTPQVRAINNPLHDPDEMETTDQVEEELSSRMSPGGHKGPNTPPEPPTSPPSSPDAYDPFEPTKSRSPTPDPMEMNASRLSLEEPRDNLDSRTAIELLEKSINPMPENISKSLTPPLADVQPADSQSSIQATPDSNVDKSPERVTVQTSQSSVAVSKPVAQTTPFSSVPTPMITSTPISSNLAPTRINILNSTIIPSTVASSIPQRMVLPNQLKSIPVKISPTKAAIKTTPIKPMLSKTKFTTRKKIQNNSSDDIILDLDSPYSPGSSDYEDLFEPPSEIVTKPVIKSKTKTPQKHQSTFDTLFGSPVYKVKSKNNRFGKKGASSNKTKTVGVKLDEDNLKILDELPNSAVEMQVKDKFLKKLNRQERVVEEVKLVLKPHYNKKRITKEEYKDILRRSVPKICHNKSGEINPTKIKNLIEAYVRKLRHSKKVTSSSSVNPLKV